MHDYCKFYFKWKVKRYFLFAAVTLIIFCCVTFRMTYLSHQENIVSNKKFLPFDSFDFIIQNEICTDEIFMLILIHSAPNHFDHRNLIRNAWGNPDIESFNIKTVFLLAAAPKFQNDIEKENSLHHDILQGSFIDSYRNLTYKHFMGLKWAAKNCSQAKYLMKMDDDIFVDIYQFVNYININFTPQKLRKNIACFIFTRGLVIRDHVSKWYVSKTEYPSDVYVDYCSGWAYLTTTDAAHLLVQAVQELNYYFWVDDVHITGTAAKVAKVNHVSLKTLYDFEAQGLVYWSNSSENLSWNKTFAPTWGDLELSKKAYRKSLACYVVQCRCCYVRTTTPQPTQPSTTKRGVVKSIF